MPRYDIFRIETDGRMCLLGTAETLQQAKERAKVLAPFSKREVWAVDELTGEKIILKPEGQRNS
jgi:hypothetical protein